MATSDTFFPCSDDDLEELRRKDPRLGEFIDLAGPVRRAIIPDVFEALVHAVAGQQISSKAQASVWARLKAALAPAGDVRARLRWEDVLAAPEEALRKSGLSGRKAAAVRGLAEAFRDGVLVPEELRRMDDEEVVSRLVSLKGIGRWSAEMVLIFCLGRKNVLSFGDFGIRRGLRMLHGHREVTPDLLRRYRDLWSPLSSVASLYLWELAGGRHPGYSDPAGPAEDSAADAAPEPPSPGRPPLSLRLLACAKGGAIPLSTAPLAGVASHLLLSGTGEPLPPSAMPDLPAGTLLELPGGRPLLRVAGRALLPAEGSPHALSCPIVEALEDVEAGEAVLTPARRGVSLAWITLSDRGFRGLREDGAGPLLPGLVSESLEVGHSRGFLLPDDGDRIRALLVHLALAEGYDLILTTGGTGVSPSDVTPQATQRVLDLELPGFSRAMTLASLDRTPRGAISRAAAGVLGRSLILNLPGSPKAVRENLAAVLPALGHAIEKLRGDPADCAEPRSGGERT